MLVTTRKRKKKMRRSDRKRERHEVYVVPFKGVNANLVILANFLMMSRYIFSWCIFLRQVHYA